jgi:hypothetical protein
MEGEKESGSLTSDFMQGNGDRRGRPLPLTQSLPTERTTGEILQWEESSYKLSQLLHRGIKVWVGQRLRIIASKKRNSDWRKKKRFIIGLQENL